VNTSLRHCGIFTDNFEVYIYGSLFFGGGWASKFLIHFYKCESPSNMCQNLVTINRATSEVRRYRQLRGTAHLIAARLDTHVQRLGSMQLTLCTLSTTYCDQSAPHSVTQHMDRISRCGYIAIRNYPFERSSI